jgi:hypothetical protein
MNDKNRALLGFGPGSEDVSPIGDAVQKGFAEPCVRDDLSPLGEWQAGGENDCGLSRPFRRQPETEILRRPPPTARIPLRQLRSDHNDSSAPQPAAAGADCSSPAPAPVPVAGSGLEVATAGLARLECAPKLPMVDLERLVVTS